MLGTIILIAWCILGMVSVPSDARRRFLGNNYFAEGWKSVAEKLFFYLLFVLLSPVYPIGFLVRQYIKRHPKVIDRRLYRRMNFSRDKKTGEEIGKQIFRQVEQEDDLPF